MSQYSYTALPTYADDVKAPLLPAHDHDGVVINFNNNLVDGPQQVAPHGQEQQEGACARRCGGGGGGFFARIRARRAARCAERFGPPCENPRCLRTRRKRRAFRFVIFSLISLWAFVALFKGAYMMYTLPKRIDCVPITDTTSTYDLPMSKKLFLDYGLTTGTTTIAHSADTNTTTLKVTLADLSDDTELLFCTGSFKRGVGVGVYAKEKHAKVPKIVETVITLPEDVESPMIKFGGKKAGHCAHKVVRKVLKWKEHKGE